MPADPLMSLWAKLPRGSGAPQSYHPLLCHMIDVALVAQAMWREVLSSAARWRIAEALRLDEEVAERWVAFWAGLHDLGKASPAFQQMDSSARGRVRPFGLSWPDGPVEKVPHGTITAYTLPDILTGSDFGVGQQPARQVATAIGGHHGAFPSSLDLIALEGADHAVGAGPWNAVRAALARTLADTLEVPRATPPHQLDNTTAMLLAGLVSVADWIGSNMEFFRYAVADAAAIPSLDGVAYARQVVDRPQEALQRLRWSRRGTGPAAFTQPRGFADLFGAGFVPNPLQREIARLAQRSQGPSDEPSLVIVEAPMGEGKTEAALYLAHRWSVALGQRGFYVGLPTQATSNQMFGRVARFLGASHASDDAANLQLLHGHAALSAEFALLKANDDQPFVPEDVHGDEGYDRAPPNVVAGEWFTYRKRGLLAQFGVGTVDQSLLAVLQTKHVFVRLFGLAHKTVIIDEIHAYDAYMTALLERLLEWLGALGTSVILLSATLPKGRREALARGYARGLGRPDAAALALPRSPYPRVSWVTVSGMGADTMEVSARAAKSVHVQWIDGRLPASASESFELGKMLSKALAGGGCAVVICNTVSRAQRMYRALHRSFAGLAEDDRPELDLLHARYPFRERAAREKRTLLRFGKEGSSVWFDDSELHGIRRPRRAVLVATQIVEQSLDLDFDLMVTDLAPADLVLQRLGRLHRHQRSRPAGFATPNLWLCGPEDVRDGVPRFDRGTAAVYDPHVLLRSWLELQARATLAIPDDVEPIVEGVYADDRPCPAEAGATVRAAWEVTLVEQRQSLEEEQRQAQTRWLDRPASASPLWRLTRNSLEEDAPDFHPAHQALTRLAEPSVAVVCLYGSPERPTLDPDLAESVRLSATPTLALAVRLLSRSVTLTDKRVIFELRSRPTPTGWSRSPLLRHHRLLVFSTDGVVHVGNYQVHLDPDVGVEVWASDGEHGVGRET